METGRCPWAPTVGSSTQLCLHLFQPPGGSQVPSHCCPIPWIPPDNKVEKRRVGGWVDGGALGEAPPPPRSASPFLPLRLSPPLSHRSPQHGRINAENEPSSRMGPMGPGPQVTSRQSVCPSR